MVSGNTPWPAWAHELRVDRLLSPGDIGAWLCQVYFLPGDYLLFTVLTRAPMAAEFLSLGSDDYGSTASGALSGGVWLLLIVATRAAYRLVSTLDRLMTAFIAHICVNTARRVRQTRADDSYRVEVSELAELDLGVLRSCTRLAPGHVLTVSEAAHMFGVHGSEIRKVLENLRKLQLLSVGFAAIDGEESYALTRAGAAYLRSLRSSASAFAPAQSGSRLWRPTPGMHV